MRLEAFSQRPEAWAWHCDVRDSNLQETDLTVGLAATLVEAADLLQVRQSSLPKFEVLKLHHAPTGLDTKATHITQRHGCWGAMCDGVPPVLEATVCNGHVR